MSKQSWKKSSIRGVIVEGGRVASGLSEKNPFPAGTIPLQAPFFKSRGLDISEFYPATVNVSIAPFNFQIVKPRYIFRNIKWTANYEAEHFSFVDIIVRFQEHNYECLVYYPHPETKLGFEKGAIVLEILAPFIRNLSYGAPIELFYCNNEIEISQ